MTEVTNAMLRMAVWTQIEKLQDVNQMLVDKVRAEDKLNSGVSQLLYHIEANAKSVGELAEKAASIY